MSRNAAKLLLESGKRVARVPVLRQVSVGICTVTAALGCVADGSEPPAMPLPGVAPCELRSELYRIDDVRLPLSASEAAVLGLDLDSDPARRPDNSAGVALSWLLGSWNDSGAMLHAELRAAFEDERALWLVEVETCAGEAQVSGDYVRIGVHRGAPSGAQGAAEIADRSPPAEGWRLDGGVVRARGGEGMVPASALMDFLGMRPEVAWARGDGLAVELQPSPQGELQGRLGLGCDDGLRQITGSVMAEFYTRKLVEGTSNFARALDANADGTVTAEEFLEAEAIRVLLADDVDLMAEHEGSLVYEPNMDGIADRLSLGVWFHARLVAP